MLLMMDQTKRKEHPKSNPNNCTGCAVLDIKSRLAVKALYPDWFVKLIPTFGAVVYHEDVAKDFEIQEDPKRFAEGWSFVCKHCGCVAQQRYDYAEESHTWLLVKIRCRVGCGRSWRSDEVEPIWVRVLEDWSVSAEEQERAHLALEEDKRLHPEAYVTDEEE